MLMTFIRDTKGMQIDPRIEQCQLISGPCGFRTGKSGLDALFPNLRPRFQLLLQEICLIEKKNEMGIFEQLIGANGRK